MIRLETHPGLHGTLMLQVVLPVVLLLAALLAIAQQVLTNFTENRLERDLRQVARAVELPVARALESGDEAQLYANLTSVFELSEVYGAYVFDADGIRQASFGTVRPTAIQSYQAVSLGMNVEEEFDQYESISGRDVYSFFLPLFDTTGQPNGLLQVTRRRSDIDSELGQLRTWSWAGSVLLMLVLTGLIFLAHRRAIGRPIDHLLDSMQQVKIGKLQHRARPTGPTEIRSLATGLNSMLDAIAEARQKTREEQAARKAMADKLRQSETMALLGHIAGGVAHELGAPLSVVDGRAVRVLRECKDENMRRELETIRQQTHRMQTLLEQLLSFGRNSREPLVLVPAAILIQSSIAQLPDGAQRISLVPGPDASLRARVQSLEQALGNLLRNALQACPEGKIEAGWFERQSLQGKRQVCLFVHDRGTGIATSLRETMFEPFVTNKPAGKGSGMGLAIVRRVVEDHDGSIEADSDSSGTRFILCFPAVDEGDE